MQSRIYAVAFIAFSAGLFALGLIANVLLDPEGILGTGVTKERVSSNGRYQRFAEYERAAEQYDGLMFGSSRGSGVPLDELSRRLKAHVANFTMLAGTMADFEPMLRYVLTSKLERGQHLRAVFLLLDLDGFGVAGPTGRSLQTMLPPEVSGESRVHFYWRYLSGFQFDPWRFAIFEVLRKARTDARFVDGDRSAAAFAAEVAPPPQSAPSAAPVPVQLTRRWTAEDFALQLELLREFVGLCRQHEVRLVVATSPLHRRNAMLAGAEQLARRRDSIAAITPVWDFGSPDWLSDRPDLWLDDGHFLTPVGKMMLDAIFDPATGSAPTGFGRLYGN